MDNQEFTIWAIDDDPLQRMFIQDELGADWPLRIFESGEAALEALDSSPSPSMALCDVLMPGMDGFTVCRHLREADANMQILFLSSNTGNEAKLCGMDAGCDDYLEKPIDGEELRYKIQLAQRARQHRHQLSSEIATVRSFAFDAMTNAGELGTVLEFMRRSQECATEQTLAVSLLQGIRAGYDLVGSIRLRRPDYSVLDLDENGEACSPLASSILDNMQAMERIFSFKNRICINYPSLTLLIHNMPEDNPDKLGRLRDHLAIIADSAERRLHSIRNEMLLQRQTQGLTLSIREMTEALAALETQHFRFNAEINERVLLFCEQIRHLTIGFGLTDEQEFKLDQSVNEFGEAIRQLDLQQVGTDRQLKNTLQRLRELAQQSSQC
ncbi:response regulator transcription factor [Chromobacterium sp. IIBBL 290-4]|uniref:response regulator transcription factor n=1 Tax=Chromobacterium sp. IIBBL 290-4 TaxID=2953890 RepID=UPI0020B8E95C|nr:response regulator [Chromobacterium sp. IIBBL 290-4]UTH76684.1 response regulator [Chromobacterium sp. IIBBL 290-4]